VARINNSLASFPPQLLSSLGAAIPGAVHALPSLPRRAQSSVQIAKPKAVVELVSSIEHLVESVGEECIRGVYERSA
jgi:hypothetical protein